MFDERETTVMHAIQGAGVPRVRGSQSHSDSNVILKRRDKIVVVLALTLPLLAMIAGTMLGGVATGLAAGAAMYVVLCVVGAMAERVFRA